MTMLLSELQVDSNQTLQFQGVRKKRFGRSADLTKAQHYQEEQLLIRLLSILVIKVFAYLHIAK